MMRFSFSDRECPPDRFRYTFPDGTRILESSKAEWFNAIKAHYQRNEIPMPENWAAIAEDQLCKLLPPGWCKYDDGTGAWGVVDTRLSMGDLFRGMEVLTRIVMDPDPLVDQATAEERGKICAGCPVNFTIEGCAPCMKIGDAVAKVKGSRTTEADPFLKDCGICKCRSSANIWIKDRVLAKGITPAMHEQFKAFPHCWKALVPPEG